MLADDIQEHDFSTLFSFFIYRGTEMLAHSRTGYVDDFAVISLAIGIDIYWQLSGRMLLFSRQSAQPSTIDTVRTGSTRNTQ